MKFTLKMMAFTLALALASWHCGGAGTQPGDTTSTDSTAAEQLLFAGWVDTTEAPILMSLAVRGEDVQGTVTYVKVDKPIQLMGNRVDGKFHLEESLDGKTTGVWSFSWDNEGASADVDGKMKISGDWRKSKTETASMPVELRPIRPLTLTDAELKRRFEGGYGSPEPGEMESSDEEADAASAEEFEEHATMEMAYVGSRHFSFSMSTTTVGGYGCGADGYIVMVAPDTAMFWGTHECVVRFVFHPNSVSSQMLQWSSYYCGAGPTGFDAEMVKQ